MCNKILIVLTLLLSGPVFTADRWYAPGMIINKTRKVFHVKGDEYNDDGSIKSSIQIIERGTKAGRSVYYRAIDQFREDRVYEMVDADFIVIPENTMINGNIQRIQPIKNNAGDISRYSVQVVKIGAGSYELEEEVEGCYNIIPHDLPTQIVTLLQNNMKVSTTVLTIEEYNRVFK